MSREAKVDKGAGGKIKGEEGTLKRNRGPISSGECQQNRSLKLFKMCELDSLEVVAETNSKIFKSSNLSRLIEK